MAYKKLAQLESEPETVQHYSDAPIAISVKHLHKSFKLPTERAWGLKQAIFNRLKGIKGYKELKVLNGISFDIHQNEFIGIVGRNGSGKSTLAKLLNGLYKPTNGEVLVDGISTLDDETELEIKRRVGLVFQNPDNQFIGSTVEDDIAFGLENRCVEPSLMQGVIEEYANNNYQGYLQNYNIIHYIKCS